MMDCLHFAEWSGEHNVWLSLILRNIIRINAGDILVLLFLGVVILCIQISSALLDQYDFLVYIIIL